jgi:hypothetical protein
MSKDKALHTSNADDYLICIMDNVEGNGLTKGMRYEILAEKDNMYCIVDDNNNLNVYHNIFFDRVLMVKTI